ncbi:hypothetical protein Tco_0924593 [Tanacetum coccineum]|uniref:Uncharacterized protein n=1 Tax=Tanacetum coccineum TaxID=301880 RepID=A0ABQ5D5E0_9ASTR
MGEGRWGGWDGEGWVGWFGWRGCWEGPVLFRGCGCMWLWIVEEGMERYSEGWGNGVGWGGVSGSGVFRREGSRKGLDLGRRVSVVATGDLWGRGVYGVWGKAEWVWLWLVKGACGEGWLYGGK